MVEVHMINEAGITLDDNRSYKIILKAIKKGKNVTLELADVNKKLYINTNQINWIIKKQIKLQF